MLALTAESPPDSMAIVGEQLRQARENAKLTLGEVADQTKIRKDHLEALESGDYSVFAAPVYVRGFVRTYAKLLKLNTAEMLLELDQELGETPKFANQQGFTPKKTFLDFLMLQLSKINWRVALPLFSVALLLLVTLLVYRSWTTRKAPEDPLKNLGPGLYQGRKQGEVLPIPRPVQPAPKPAPKR